MKGGRTSRTADRRRRLGMLAGLALCASQAVQAIPAVTGAEARAFLGGRTGKVVYLKNYDGQLYFIDFNDSVLVERRISEDIYCYNPMISADGTRVLYEYNSAVWIRDLVENSKVAHRIFSRAPVLGQTMEPHWWIDPATKSEYVQFTTGTMDDLQWPPRQGTTYLRKVVKSDTSGPLLTLMPYQMSAARSKNGMWGSTSHHSTGMYRFYPGQVENAFYESRNWTEMGVLAACNASTSPSDDPARQDRMMHLTSGGTSMGGVPYDNHKAIIIRSWKDPDPDHPLWWIGPPGDRCNNDGSGNLFWGYPEWSTDENFFTATGSKDIDVVNEGDLYMGRINYGSDSRILRVLKGGGRNLTPHLWVKTGVAPAKIRLDRASLSFYAFRKDPADPPPDTIKAGNAGDGTLPALSLGPLPKWLKVAILGNGGNSPRLVTSVLRDSVVPGTYQAAVSVTFGQGADSASYAVTFTYSDPVLTSLKPSPSLAVLGPGDSLRLTASALDQAGKPMADTSAVTWEAMGSAVPGLSPDGRLRVDSAYWKSYAVIGRAGAVRCTVQVAVVRRLLRIDAGAEAGKAPAGWEEDGKYARGGSLGNAQDTLSPPGAVDPAPPAVFRTWRQGFAGYSFPDLPDGRYRVRLHFAAQKPGAPGAGAITLEMEGVKVLEDYRLTAPADSHTRAAEVREVSITVSDGQGLELEASAPAGAPALAGLELYDTGLPPVMVVSPNGGETRKVGDTLSIRWNTDPAIASCGIQVSVDSGATWIPLTRLKSVKPGDANWEDFRWAIPDSLDGVSLVSAQAMVSVYDYFGSDRDRSNRVFSIQANPDALAKAERKAAGFAFFLLPEGRLRLDLDAGTDLRSAQLHDTRGRLLRSYRIDGAGARARVQFLEVGSLPRGMYRLTLLGPGLLHSRLLPWLP